MKSHLNAARLGAFAVICITATACVACGSHTVSSPGPSSSAAAPQTGSASAAPATGGTFSGSEQPWTVDVSGAAKSDRSDAILAALTAAGGWGNDNVLQTDFSISIFNADSSTPRMNVVGIEDYCGGGPDCDSVPTRDAGAGGRQYRRLTGSFLRHLGQHRGTGRLPSPGHGPRRAEAVRALPGQPVR